MATPPKVSVIVPSYNHAPYLAQRLDSILAQTFQDFELLFLDDASPDHTREVFARYAQNPRIRAVLNERNSGNVFKQWNRGLGMAQGEYVWIAESDDYADPEFLATLVATLEAHPEVGVAYCESQIVDEAGVFKERTSDWYLGFGYARWQKDFLSRGIVECRTFAGAWNIIPNASSAVFRRKLALEIGGAPTDLRLTGDWVFWNGLLSTSDLAYSARPLNYYRVHSGTVRSASRANLIDIEEGYRVLGGFKSRFGSDSTLSGVSFNRLADSWFWRHYSPGQRIPWKRHLEVLVQAHRADRLAGLRMARRWLKLRIGSVLRRVGLAKKSE